MSSGNNFFNFDRRIFNNETMTINDLRNHATKRKEKQLLEHRKKIMKDIYTKMFTNDMKKIENNNNNAKTNTDNMELEEEINNNINKKQLIEKCLTNAKDLYDKLGEEFIYQIIDDKKISFCPKCTYPVIIVDKINSEEKNNSNNSNSDSVIISCVNSCFQFDLSESIFNKYSMDNIMDLYSQSLKNDNECNHNDIAPITSGDDGILFTCVTCLFEQFK